MRTAEVIWEEEQVLWEMTIGGSLEDHILHAINKGRVEAIKECIEIVNENSILGANNFIQPNLKKLLEQIK